jgi:hypothetical protein
MRGRRPEYSAGSYPAHKDLENEISLEKNLDIIARYV